MTPAQWLTELLDAVGSKPVGRSPRQCPAHRDAAPSLTVGTGRSGQALVKCHAGCDWRKILTALGCGGNVLYASPPVSPWRYGALFCAGLHFPALTAGARGHPGASGYRLAAVHDYGGWMLERWRHEVTGAKELRWHTVRDGVAVPGLFGVELSKLPLYREPDVRQGVAAGEPVIMVESESSVDALAGWYATTWAGSASTVPVQTIRAVLGGYQRLIYVPDLDEAGLRCARKLRAAGLAPHVIVGRIGEDARDLLDREGRDGFARLVSEALG